jgi:two-component system alkaline phosphatase synthesis response regulator PhoP
MAENHKILLVDDEPDILEFIRYNLIKEGFTVLTAGTGREAVEITKTEIPDLVVLDVMMPEMDGIETCRQLRENPKLANTIIAFLTARSEDYSQIAGFDSGADDYITKPIKPRVLISRIKALLRRSSGQSSSNDGILEFNGITIDRNRFLVVKKGKDITLPKKEFELLSLLASKPGKVFTRDEILTKVWGDLVVVGDRTIDVHVRKLREKLGDDALKTVKGVGYKFEY